MLIDLHSHSTLSDGTLSIEQMVAAAERSGYTAFAITDHVRGSDSNYHHMVLAVRSEIERLQRQTRVQLFAGVELTDFAPGEIPVVAREVRRVGAEVVVVHGECVSLDTAPGTNAAAVRCPDVDILGHPGLLTQEDAEMSARTGVYLELSAIVGASYANGHVCGMARRTGAPVCVDSDAHDEEGLLTERKVEGLVRGSGASDLFLDQIRTRYTPALLTKLLSRHAIAS